MSDAEAPLVFETPGGLSVRFRGRALYSEREPRKLPQKVAASCERGPSRLILAPSPLLWYGVPELLDAMGPGSALLCVEAEGELAALARTTRPHELAVERRVAFVEASSPEEAVEAARGLGLALGLGAFRTCTMVALSGGAALHAAAYEAMAAALRSEFEASWRNRAALMVLGDRWAKNIFDNLATLASIAPEPIPRFPGAVVVCGAGPSLEGALPFIRSSRRRLGVVSCDTALGTLLSAGIEPDLAVCLEGQAHNLADFTCLGSRRVSLVGDLSSHPASFRAVRGPKHLSLVRITPSPTLARIESALWKAGIPFFGAPPLGSVGVHAAHLASALARGPLLATGLDFSFEPGKTHARGCPSLLVEERKLDRLTRWPGQFAVSFRERTLRLEGGAEASPRGLLSDPTLVSYAALLASGAASGAGKAPLYDLRAGYGEGRGPSIGGRGIGLAEAQSLVAAAFADGRGGSPREQRRAARTKLWCHGAFAPSAARKSRRP